MNNAKHISIVLGFAALLSLVAAKPATKPSTQPATVAMADDQIHFVAPGDPWASFHVKEPDTAYYQTPKGESAVQIIWAPRDFQIAADTVGSFAAGITKTLKKQREDARQEMVMAPKIEKDSRFDIVIHEKFKVSKEFTQDQLHLYKSVGPRVLMVTVSCVSNDEETIKAAHKVAEDLLDSCKYNRKAFKKTK